MSEKRYELGLGATVMNDVFSVIRDTETGVSFEAPTACNLLNRQAEQLEVLREWIRKTPQGQEMILQAQFWAARESKPEGGTWEDPVRQESEARIAALEGK